MKRAREGVEQGQSAEPQTSPRKTVDKNLSTKKSQELTDFFKNESEKVKQETENFNEKFAKFQSSFSHEIFDKKNYLRKCQEIIGLYKEEIEEAEKQTTGGVLPTSNKLLEGFLEKTAITLGKNRLINLIAYWGKIKAEIDQYEPNHLSPAETNSPLQELDKIMEREKNLLANEPDKHIEFLAKITMGIKNTATKTELIPPSNSFS